MNKVVKVFEKVGKIIRFGIILENVITLKYCLHYSSVMKIDISNN